jgi:DNA-binding MarR family transcriptional regulator
MTEDSVMLVDPGAGESVVPLLVADVFEAAGVLRQVGEAIAATQGQTQARWQLLSVVSARPCSVPQAARRLGVSRQAVQRVANDLVDAALIEFTANPDHRTSPLLALTPAGRTTLERITARADDHLIRPLAQALGQRAVADARQTLRALVSEVRRIEAAEDSG